MTRLGRARIVVPVVLLAAFAAVVTGRLTWLSGSVDDAVLGSSPVTASGTQALPGLVALALVLAAGVLAAATSALVLRRITLVVTAAGCVALAVLAVRAATAAPSILGGIAAGASGRTGTIPVTGTHANAWPYVVAALSTAALVAVLAGLVASRTWRGLSAAYDAPAQAPAPGVEGGSSARGARVDTAWDQLERGIDPTTERPG